MEIGVLSRGKAGVDWPAEVARWRSGGDKSCSRAAYCRARELPYPSFICKRAMNRIWFGKGNWA
jgi:hypothetical protein